MLSSTLKNYGKIESRLHSAEIVAGVDEVGRGAWAGPVYTAAVILDRSKLRAIAAEKRQLIRDSKTLSSKQRGESAKIIAHIALAQAVDAAELSELYELGLNKATHLSMLRSLKKLQCKPDIVLVDGKHAIPGYSGRQQAIVGGDGLCYSIAAASIVAKLARDTFMKEQALLYGGYHFEHNVGYGTLAHRQALAKQGICPIHRLRFKPIAQLGR